MPLGSYGVLVGKACDARRETSANTPHYQVRLLAAGASHRIAVNVKSSESPSDLLFRVDEDFHHPILAGLEGLGEGFTPLSSRPGGEALDYIRGNLFDPATMRPLPPNLPGPDNDLSDRIEHFARRAIEEEDARVFAFGQRWGPEPATPDKVFGFKPGNGIHDIHMNQGNSPAFKRDDGVWQDGGLLLRFPATDQWVAVFLAFQSQAWHTDDQTGHALAVEEPTEGLLRIVAAMVNPQGGPAGQQAVVLLNPAPRAVHLEGWAIADREKRRRRLSGSIGAGEALTVKLAAPVALGKAGGAITLLDPKGLKVHGVSYTQREARREGWLVVF
jgi:uncharacterized protein YukJ